MRRKVSGLTTGARDIGPANSSTLTQLFNCTWKVQFNESLNGRTSTLYADCGLPLSDVCGLRPNPGRGGTVTGPPTILLAVSSVRPVATLVPSYIAPELLRCGAG
eukprot:g62163.t1